MSLYSLKKVEDIYIGTLQRNRIYIKELANIIVGADKAEIRSTDQQDRKKLRENFTLCFWERSYYLNPFNWLDEAHLHYWVQLL